jgi:hypothetical protein
MVDFKKLVRKEVQVDLKSLLAVFDSLDRQTSHIDLRPAQQKALEILSTRREEHDHVLKISTGAGKTSIGLLYLFSYMEEHQQPVVYLCPTNQLVDQVCAESTKLGIKAVRYPAGETFPHVDGISAKAIIVCTYDKLFNARTTFDRNDVMLRPCAIVLDDAHAGVEEIRDSFTLAIRGNNALNGELMIILSETCQKYKAGVWRDIKDGDPNQLMEVPFWIWKPLLPRIEEVLSSHSDDDEFRFVIPHIRDLLRWCRCVVSGSGIEIVPDVLPVQKSDAYIKAKHRLFMSATLADDSVLVRELNCSMDAANDPIIPSNDKGVGERMVLAPSLIESKLDRAWVMGLCAMQSRKYRVVILSPSEQKAREWEAQGAKVFMRDSVSSGIEKLRSNAGTMNFAVFVQRYDGIDLPDGACRILVIDGMPLGEGIVDRYDSSLNATPGGVRNRLVYRIEQGIGRAVRSHADYAVVLLAGPELAHFIAKHEILSAMNIDTQAQLRLALHLAKLAMEDSPSDAESAVVDMIKKCLSRDEGWKQFYNEMVREAEKTTIGSTNPDRILMASAERKAFDAVLANDPNKAAIILRKAINKNIHDDSFAKGWYLQRVANYLYEVEPGEGLEVQRSAYECNSSMSRPPTVIKRPIGAKKENMYTIMTKWFGQFDNPNGAMASIQDLKARLSFDGSPAGLEQAVCDLAPLLGAIGLRPEKDYGEGPDDLWLWEDVSLVIEAKNENEESLHKRDAGQLLLSLKWFKETYPTRSDPIPIIVAKVNITDRNSGFPGNTRILTPEKINSLLTALEGLYSKMISEPLFSSDPKSLARIQNDLKIFPDRFVSSFTVNFRESNV